MSSKFSAFCSKILEVGWLLAVVVTPLFFNIWSDRVFEPDKLTCLRTIAVLMAAVWLAKRVEERASGRPGLEINWRMPLVLPTVFTLAVYLLSTLLSVTFRVSLFGSYQRLQGTYTTYSYIVVFLIILQEMRSRTQFDRLLTVIILNSLPIALYGFLQRNGLDPLPWGGDVTRRIASNMGNPIFVGAYLIMAALPTLARVVDAFRSILRDEDTGTADVLRAAAYIFIFLVQVIAVWYTLSRGPQMGLLAGLAVWAFAGLLSLQRAAQRERPFQPGDLVRDLGRGLAFVVGSLAVAAGMAAAGYYIAGGPQAESSTAEWVAAGLAVLTWLGTWMVFVANRWGWRWLWMSAVLLGLIFGSGFLVINLVEPVHEWSRNQPWMGRLDDVLQPESGTGKVRSLLWEQALALWSPHEPLEYPPPPENPDTWREDSLNFIRPLVGYGPESMFVAANRFYPPDLAHHEKRTSSGDRAHNETMDTLVITGLLGFSAYLWMFGSIFYLGLRWLGLVPGDWRRKALLILLPVGAILATVAVAATAGFHFFGLAVPVGMIGGMLIYMVVYGFSLYREPEPVSEDHPNAILLIGLLGAFAAHLVEINFGIAIASTRTTFWAYAGMFAVAGMNLLNGQPAGQQEAQQTNEQQSPGKRRRRRRRKREKDPLQPAGPAWLGSTLAAAIVLGFILGTLGFDLIGTNPKSHTNPFEIVWKSMTTLPFDENRTSYGVLMVFGLTWAMSGVVVLSQMAKRLEFREHKGDWALATVTYLLVSLTVGFGFTLVLAGRQVAMLDFQAGLEQLTLEALMAIADRVANHLAAYYVFIALTMVGGGAVLFFFSQRPRQTAQAWGPVALVVLTLLAGITAIKTNMYPIQADMIYKLGARWRQDKVWFAAIEHDNAAIARDPLQDQYYLYKAMDLQKQIWDIDDATQKQIELRTFEQTALEAQALNPLATDHSVNLARVYQTWWQAAPDEDTRLALAASTSRYYETALRLSPNNALIWNQWAQYLTQAGNFQLAQEKLDASFALDTEFDETWIIQANLYLAQNRTDEAIGALPQAIELSPNRTDIRLHLGNILVNEGRYQEAIDTYLSALDIRPNLSDAWVRIGRAHAAQGAITEAIKAYDEALTIRPGQAEVWTQIAELYYQQGLIPDAITAYEQSLAINPDQVNVWLRLGDVRLGENQLEEAAEAYERALDLNANHAQAWRVLAYVYAQLERLEDAVAAMQRALDLEPEHEDAWDGHRFLAIVYNDLGQGDVALAHAQSAYELAPAGKKDEMQALVLQLSVGDTP